MNKSIIYAIDMVLLVGTLLILLMSINYAAPLVIAPVSNLTETDVLMTVGNVETIFLDTSNNFQNAQTFLLSDGLTLELFPGTYFIKYSEESITQIRSFIIQSNVILTFRKVGKSYEIINGGEKNIRVELNDINSKVDEVILTSNKGGKS